MIMEQIEALTPEQAIALRDWEELFKSNGWQRLMQWAQEYDDSLMSSILNGSGSYQKIDEFRGQRYVVGTLLAWEDATEAEFRQVVEASAVDADEVREGRGANA